MWHLVKTTQEARILTRIDLYYNDANAARPNRCPQEQQPARAWGYEVDVDVEGGPEVLWGLGTEAETSCAAKLFEELASRYQVKYL